MMQLLRLWLQAAILVMEASCVAYRAMRRQAQQLTVQSTSGILRLVRGGMTVSKKRSARMRQARVPPPRQRLRAPPLSWLSPL